MTDISDSGADPGTDFDFEVDRRGSYSSKWEKYAGQDVLPFWVADMDFAAPDFIIDAIQARLNHRILGYTITPQPLVEAFVDWLQRNYGWSVSQDWLVWLPGVVNGLNMAARACATPGGAIMVPTPVYYPFLSAPGNAQQEGIEVCLIRDGDRWVMDFEAWGKAHRKDTRLFMLCNPQNPTGRCYSAAELTKLAAFCLERNMVICSDEIHCSLLLDPNARHVPIASLSDEIAKQSITLFAATKTYNFPGVGCAVAVIPNAELRSRFRDAEVGLVSEVGPLAYQASLAAYSDESSWLPRLLAYLRGNHRRLQDAAGARMTPVEATYLGWIDVRDLKQGNPGRHFERHGLGLSDGGRFGGPGFVRFNFACPRPLLDRGLVRLRQALEALQSPLA